MPARTSPARVAAYFRALEQTGNLTLAAERARVSQTWARERRAADPAFAARMTAAIETARARLRDAAAGRGIAPPAGWRSLHGEELVVRGGPGRPVQIARARLHQWTPRTEARFLAALAACCNVRAACRVVGMTPPAAYHHYDRYHDFATRWNAALAEGYGRLEMALFDMAGRAFRPVDYPPDIPIEPMTYDQAISLLRIHEERVHGTGKPRHRLRPPRRTDDEVFASLAHKLDRLAKMEQRRATADPAADDRAVAAGMRVVAGTGKENSGATRE